MSRDQRTPARMNRAELPRWFSQNNVSISNAAARNRSRIPVVKFDDLRAESNMYGQAARVFQNLTNNLIQVYNAVKRRKVDVELDSATIDKGLQIEQMFKEHPEYLEDEEKARKQLNSYIGELKEMGAGEAQTGYRVEQLKQTYLKSKYAAASNKIQNDIIETKINIDRQVDEYLHQVATDDSLPHEEKQRLMNARIEQDYSDPMYFSPIEREKKYDEVRTYIDFAKIEEGVFDENTLLSPDTFKMLANIQQKRVLEDKVLGDLKRLEEIKYKQRVVADFNRLEYLANKDKLSQEDSMELSNMFDFSDLNYTTDNNILNYVKLKNINMSNISYEQIRKIDNIAVQTVLINEKNRQLAYVERIENQQQDRSMDFTYTPMVKDGIEDYEKKLEDYRMDNPHLSASEAKFTFNKEVVPKLKSNQMSNQQSNNAEIDRIMYGN